MITIRLKELAEARGLTKNQVQKRTGLDIGMVRRYWNNHSDTVHLPSIDKLCALLDCEPGDLIKRTPPAGERR